MTETCRIFLGWEKPLPQLAVQRLFAYAENPGPIDFSAYRIIVPTAEAGRLLREALAEHAPEGIMGLDILLPDMLFRQETESPATAAEVLAAWSRTLENIQPQKTEPLLGPRFADVRHSPETRLAAGDLLQNCRKELAADGSNVSRAARYFRQAGMPEQAERFEIFEELEKEFLRHCPHDPVQLQQKILPPESDTRKVIVLHCPDIRGAAVKYLQNCPGRVEYWIHAPAELADMFDEAGRALPCWNKREFPVDTKKQLRITIHAEDQIPLLSDLRKNTDQQIRAIGILDPALAGAWQDQLRRSTGGDSPVFFPAMQPLKSMQWTKLFCALLELRRSAPDRDSTAAILHNGFLADRKTLAMMDKLQQESLAQTLPALYRAAGPGKSKDTLGKLLNWHKQLAAAADGKVLSECWNILRSIGESPACPPFDRRKSLQELSVLESLITAAEHAAGSSADLAVALFHQLCSTAQIHPVQSGGETLDAVGFLELPWYGDNTVILAGLSENVLSGNRFADPFLPEQAKKLLNLQTAEQSSAADAFRFAAMQNTAELRFLVCRYGMRQDALKPPAILMRCPEKDLPQRIGDIFGSRFVLPSPVEKKLPLPPLVPRREIPEKKRLSVTDFAQYLRCPFTYYLQKILRAENADGKAIELDHAQSGTILHSIIAACESAIKNGAETNDLFQCAAEHLAISRHQFGEPPPGLLDLQFAIMEDNLRYFAEAQTKWYDHGWRLVRSELHPEETALPPCSWADFYHKVFPDALREEWRESIEFKGRFDRLDARERDGLRELCVIDYKTGAAKKPAEKHFISASGLTEEEKNYRAVPGLNKYWSDLQLPLYVLMIRHLLPEESADRISAAYFNLPTAYASTGVYEFHELDEDLLRSAMLCADQIARRIHGPHPVFWPPRQPDTLFEQYEKLAEEDFAVDDFFLPCPNEEARS